MSRFWSARVHDLVPYVPGEQPKTRDLVKLNTNECPYPPSPHVAGAVAEAAGSLRLYPDPASTALREAAARANGLSPEQVFVGNGSDEVLAHSFQALLKQDRPLLFPDITYSFYPVYCGLYDIAFQTVPLDEGFAVRVEDYRQPCGAIILPNPNAPTGTPLPLREIERLLREHPDVPVVVDEAYVAFGAESAAPLIRHHPNLLVVRTLSKSHALAGLRVGFALGDPALIEALVRVKDSFNSYPIDRLAEAAAIAALDDRAWFDHTVGRIRADRERLRAGLEGLGFRVLPSDANFLFASHPDRDGAALQAALRAEGVLVRHFNKERIAGFLRITVGTTAECDRLLGALRRILRPT
ncbi:histidinol-phosphate transaminase [Rhizosaccharibacter radicis]|uniref:Histidinol-phosphate aminotransferase n=1 Tax=Rhizosaccharibacter radicis TaxID=2782605 RepID=A0ABT1VUF9_9PROT|nr:histidinol-phosphate transaminase [Acetobacteraceae bacterium KSS12]